MRQVKNKASKQTLTLSGMTRHVKDCKMLCFVVARLFYGRIVRKTNDNGLGFDMDKVRDKIFGFHQTFHDLDDSKEIVLYLVHTQVTSFGGKIKVESKINEGAKLTISFKE